VKLVLDTIFADTGNIIPSVIFCGLIKLSEVFSLRSNPGGGIDCSVTRDVAQKY